MKASSQNPASFFADWRWVIIKGLYSTFNTTFLCGVKPPASELTAGASVAHPNPAASSLNAAKTWGGKSGSLMQRSTNLINGGLFVVRSPSLVLTFELVPYCCKWSAGSQLRSCSSNLTKKGERGPPLTELSWDPAGSNRLSLGAAARTVRGLKGDNHNGEVLETLLRQETGGKPSGEQQPLKGECSPFISHARTLTSSKKSGISQLVNLTTRTNGKYRNLTEIVADPDVLLAAFEKLKLSQPEFDSAILSQENPARVTESPKYTLPLGVHFDGTLESINWLNDASRHLLNGSYRFIYSKMIQNKPGIAASKNQGCRGTSSLRRAPCESGKSQRFHQGSRGSRSYHPGDMVVQEVIRMVLESIYETQRFAQARSAHLCLHTHPFGGSFRPNRFFALKEIKNTWNGVSWLLKFDIKQSFDRIYIRRFILLLKDKIHDQRFFDLIQKMFNSALSVQQSCTMGGEGRSFEEIVPVLSPLLSNIYMHSLDSEALEVQKDYETPCASSACSKWTKRAAPADPRIYDRRLNQKFRNTIKVTSAERRQLNDDYERIVALKVGRERIARRRGLTRKNYRDEEFIQVKYIRYANDFLFGIAGSRQLVETIGHRILHFLKVNMELEVTLYNYVHVTGGRVEFLGVYIYSVPALKWPTKLAKSVEKRRRIRNRLNIFAKQRKEALAHQLKQSVLDAWAWGFKKSKNISGLEAAKQAMYAKAATFDIGKIEPSEPLKQLLKEEKDLFSRTAWKEFPEEVKKAYYKLFEALEKQVNQYHLEDPRRGTSKAAPPLSGACFAYGVYRHPPLRLVVPLDQLMKKLRSQGVITQRKSRPSVVGSILYLPDDLIVHWFSSLAYDILNNYRCCDNFYMVKNLVDYQIRWSAIFTLTAKHKSTTHKTIKTYSKDLRITNQHGTELASFPSGSMIKALNKTLQGRSGLGFTS